MTHHQVLEQFKEYFPNLMDRVEKWYPNGKNSIRLHLLDGSEYVFTFVDKSTFRFETFSYFLESMKGEKRM